jgi:hypothetical protein
LIRLLPSAEPSAQYVSGVVVTGVARKAAAADSLGTLCAFGATRLTGHSRGAVKFLAAHPRRGRWPTSMVERRVLAARGPLESANRFLIARRHKLIAAAAVLAVGVLAAWPLRRTEPLMSGRVVPASERSGHAGASATASTPALKVQPVSNLTANAVVTPSSRSGTGSFTTTSLKPVVAGPNIATTAASLEEPAEKIHVVHEGDSLERLARRYLDDAGRAMEIFELNREVLANPHLLPLGAELRIPLKDRRPLDSRPLDRSASGAAQPVK